MCIGVEHKVGHAVQQILVGHVLQHLPVFVPGEDKRGERFCRYTGFAVHSCGRGRGTYGFVVAVVQEVGERLPEFAHRHVGKFVIFHWVGRRNVATRGFIGAGQPVCVGQTAHFAEEVVHEKTVQCLAPVHQETCGGFWAVNHKAEEGRHPLFQGIAGNAAEVLWHVLCPGL